MQIEPGKTYFDPRTGANLHVKSIRGNVVKFQADNRPIESISKKTFIAWTGIKDEVKTEPKEKVLRLHDHKKLKRGNK